MGEEVLDIAQLDQAFGATAHLKSDISDAANAHPSLTSLFNKISAHVLSLGGAVPGAAAAAEPASKKRKIEGDVPIHANGNGVSVEEKNEVAQLAVADISTVLPQRKKFTIEFTRSTIRARDQKTNEVVVGTGMPWRDVEYVFLLPVPEKAQKQYNYVLLPKANSSHEPLVFTIPHTPPKAGSITGPNAGPAAAVSDEYKTLFNWVLKACLPPSISITEADEKHFASALRQAHRPGEKAVHVKAFRGSKDGYLFFLPNGILWAFKKPLLFLPKENIQSVSYTSVLQRTFNLNVEYFEFAEGPDAETIEIEFAMLDQEDYEGIGNYVQRHGLADASLAEQRRAKKFEVNKIKDEEGNVVGVEEGGELARAGLTEQQDTAGLLGDDEDEDSEGEDYDPGSEGESEGSGSSDEDSDDDGEGGGEGEEQDDDDDDDDDEDEEL